MTEKFPRHRTQFEARLPKKKRRIHVTAPLSGTEILDILGVSKKDRRIAKRVSEGVLGSSNAKKLRNSGKSKK